MKISNLILSLFLIIWVIPFSNIQAQTKVKSIGLQMGLNDFLDDFGLIYKAKKTEKRWFRLNASTANFSAQPAESAARILFNFQTSMGLEYRIPLAKIELHHGPQFLGGLSTQALLSPENRHIVSVNSGIAYVLGAQIPIKKVWRIGLEVSPRIRATYGKRSTGGSQLNLGFDTGSIHLFTTYQFEKEKNKRKS